MRVRPPQAPDVAWSRTRTGLVEGARDEHSAPAKRLGLPAGNVESSTLKSSLAVALVKYSPGDKILTHSIDWSELAAILA